MRTQQLNEKELEHKVPFAASWHQDYADTSTIYIGNLHRGLTEGDILVMFSQYGTPTCLKLARDPKTGLSLGYAYLRYENQRSTVLAVDNFDGAQLLGQTLKVDHSRSPIDDIPLNVLYNDPDLLEHATD